MVTEVSRPRRRPVAYRDRAEGRLIGTGWQRLGQAKAGPEVAMAAARPAAFKVKMLGATG